MKTKIIILALATFAFSCGENHEENHDNHANHETHEATENHQEEEHHHAKEGDVLKLNGEEKWVVNEEMMVNVRNIEKEVTSFSGTTMEDYAKLSKGLKTSISQITSSCTMTGESHDELHKWLLPHIEMVNEFADVQTVDNASVHYDHIKESFVTFNTFFK